MNMFNNKYIKIQHLYCTGPTKCPCFKNWYSNVSLITNWNCKMALLTNWYCKVSLLTNWYCKVSLLTNWSSSWETI